MRKGKKEKWTCGRERKKEGEWERQVRWSKKQRQNWSFHQTWRLFLLSLNQLEHTLPSPFPQLLQHQSYPSLATTKLSWARRLVRTTYQYMNRLLIPLVLSFLVNCWFFIWPICTFNQLKPNFYVLNFEKAKGLIPTEICCLLSC